MDSMKYVLAYVGDWFDVGSSLIGRVRDWLELSDDEMKSFDWLVHCGTVSDNDIINDFKWCEQMCKWLTEKNLV